MTFWAVSRNLENPTDTQEAKAVNSRETSNESLEDTEIDSDDKDNTEAKT